MDSEQLSALLRSEVQSADPNLPLYQVRTAAQIIARATFGFQVVSVIFALLSGAALLLASIGLYAVIAQSVNLRRQEIGVRTALGARSREVLGMVLGEGLKQAALGMALGLAGALALSRALAFFVVGVSPSDPATFVSIIALLTAVVIAACLIPARRASRVDPVRVLRTE
ncbi:MAG: FtsX-like permease family protein [Acidobacteriota bacterium]